MELATIPMAVITASAGIYDDISIKQLNDETVEITQYNGDVANLTISSVIDENKVTSICEDLFDYYYDENDEEYKKVDDFNRKNK